MFVFLSQLEISSDLGTLQMEDASDLDCYEPVHTTQGCTCNTILFDDETLGQLTRRERTILLSLSEGDQETTLHVEELDLSQPEANSRFTAISHVRGEGLGNSSDNALPLCQIRLLQSLVDKLQGTPAGASFFWIDSLCVPVERTAKKLAARNICRVFAQATDVLVINPTIMETSRLSPDERLGAIGASSWPKRLWTLQEGAVAQHLYFQFRDRAVDLDDLLGQGSSATALSSSAQLLYQIRRFGDDLKVEDFPRRFQYGTSNVLRHKAKTTLRYYLRLCLLMLPIFQRFTTERERLRLPGVKRAIDTVYPSDARGQVGPDLSQSKEARLRRLATILELEPPASAPAKYESPRGSASSLGAPFW